MNWVPYGLFIVGLGLIQTLAAGQAAAENGASSWLKRKVPQTPQRSVPTAKVSKKAKGQGLTRTGVTRTGLTKTAAPNRRKRVPLGKTMVTPSGEDAAYIAFDQGQYLTALRLAEARAKEKDPQAHTLIGRLYAEGLGVPVNQLTAAKWYRRGAELGDIEAMFAFGVILAKGKAVKQDHSGAADMFERAARKGHAYAHYNLGLLFLSGKGKPENPHRGAQHLEFAARQGIPEAQYDLAALYQRGHGVNADAYRAATWLRRAADKGLAAAQYEYAVVLLRGHGLNADRPKIVEYLKAAADKGIAGAQNRLGHVYAKGIVGVSKSELAAAKWRMVARDAGFKDDELDDVIAKYPQKIQAAARAAASNYRNRAYVGLGGAKPK